MSEESAEQITVCLTEEGRDYETVLTALKAGLGESGAVSPALIEFLRSCLQYYREDDVAVPATSGELTTGPFRFQLRPQLVVVAMNPASRDFREQTLTIARQAGLTAIDHQNGFLFVPPSHKKKQWWRIQKPS